ncbi:cell division protein FtsL [Lacticaseibacillus hulanensis]|uniref:cell division protein FtsL n=1 Tax=Lacticaseibacillus hulanensis TaxID=2493111 RepID=UPI000FDCCCB7|nr:cell division protein FtsL [Lacticaseibacillus hulanensis]
MVDNTARALDPQTTLQPQQNPKQAPKKQAAPSVQVQPQKHVAFSPVERLLVCAIGVAVTAIAILCLFAQFGLSGARRTLQDTQEKISQTSTQIDTYQQSVSELSDSARLTAFAKAHGLTVIEGSIKRAVK